MPDTMMPLTTPVDLLHAQSRVGQAPARCDAAGGAAAGSTLVLLAVWQAGYAGADLAARAGAALGHRCRRRGRSSWTARCRITCLSHLARVVVGLAIALAAGRAAGAALRPVAGRRGCGGCAAADGPHPAPSGAGAAVHPVVRHRRDAEDRAGGAGLAVPDLPEPGGGHPRRGPEADRGGPHAGAVAGGDDPPRDPAGCAAGLPGRAALCGGRGVAEPGGRRADQRR